MTYDTLQSAKGLASEQRISSGRFLARPFSTCPRSRHTSRPGGMVTLEIGIMVSGQSLGLGPRCILRVNSPESTTRLVHAHLGPHSSRFLNHATVRAHCSSRHRGPGASLIEAHVSTGPTPTNEPDGHPTFVGGTRRHSSA